MTEKPEMSVLPMDPQPVYLIAGHSAVEQPGLSLVDGLVWAYRRRWWLVACFLVLMGVQVGTQAQMTPEQCAFTVRAERGTLDGVVVALQEEIARCGDSVRVFNPQIEFLKLGTGAKAEQTKSLVLVQVTGSATEPTPPLLEELRKVAAATAIRVGAEYLQQANLSVQVAGERLQSLRGDANATVAERSGAEMSLANARVAVQTPIVLQVSEIQRNPVTAALWKRLALAATLAGLGSVLLVIAGWGYGEVRRRASQT